MSIKVQLVDDHKILREGLKSLFNNEPDITVVAEAANGREAVAQFKKHGPDVVIMDLTMPEINGIEASRQILEVNPEAKILILSMILDHACVSEALNSGVKGFIIKDCASDELVYAIRTIMAGFPYLCREVTALVVKEYTKDVDKQLAQLTKRELDVLRLLAEGKSLKEISFQFGVSNKTVEAQRMSIMKKLNLFSVAELTKYAIREGLTSIS